MITGQLLGPVAVAVLLAKLRYHGTALHDRALLDLYCGHPLPAPLPLWSYWPLLLPDSLHPAINHLSLLSALMVKPP